MKLKNSQRNLILDHLNKVGSISGLEALQLYRIVHLPKVISRLIRDEKLSIIKDYKKDNTGARYLRYRLNTEDCKEQSGKEVYSGNLFSMAN